MKVELKTMIDVDPDGEHCGKYCQHAQLVELEIRCNLFNNFIGLPHRSKRCTLCRKLAPLPPEKEEKEAWVPVKGDHVRLIGTISGVTPEVQKSCYMQTGEVVSKVEGFSSHLAEVYFYNCYGFRKTWKVCLSQLEPAPAPTPPWTPVKGDRVRLVGKILRVSHRTQQACHMQEGEIAYPVYDGDDGEGPGALVSFLTDDEVTITCWVQLSELEPVPNKPWVPMKGDQVRLIGNILGVFPEVQESCYMQTGELVSEVRTRGDGPAVDVYFSTSCEPDKVWWVYLADLEPV